jgi:hypothetical protein
MRELVLSSIDRIEFRHHGIGVLQGYVREHCDPEVRIHIWSRKLLKPGMDLSGDIHDHRFDMISHVLHGSIEHEEFSWFYDGEGTWRMMGLTHARAAADTDYHGPTTPLTGHVTIQRRRHTITQGQSYRFPAQIFHRSPLDRMRPEDVAVTCVEKHRQQDAPARLLYPADREPVMAFGHKPDPDVIKSVLAAAKERLS